MTKKAYIEAPMTYVVQVQTQQIIAASKGVTVDGEEALTPETEEGDASYGLSRRRNDIWDDEEEEEF